MMRVLFCRDKTHQHLEFKLGSSKTSHHGFQCEFVPPTQHRPGTMIPVFWIPEDFGSESHISISPDGVPCCALISYASHILYF